MNLVVIGSVYKSRVEVSAGRSIVGSALQSCVS